MKYTVIVARISDYPRSSYFIDAANYIDAVNKKIAEGYRPIGGIAISGGFYYQAMIKIEEKK